MHVASDTDLKASLLLADTRYDEVQVRKAAQRRENRNAAIEDLEMRHSAEEKA